MQQVSRDKLFELVEALRSGEASAFEQLYLHYEARLYAFAYRLVRSKEDAEEVVQEVFVKVWESRRFLDPEQNFDGYLFRIARNLVYNKAKRQVHEFAFSKYLSENVSYAENQTGDAIAYTELNNLLEEIYATLPPVRRQVFVMSRIEGLSNSEIAATLNTSNSNIENHINKALKTIKEKVKGYEVVYSCVFVLIKIYSDN